jgi:VanZ family protein
VTAPPAFPLSGTTWSFDFRRGLRPAAHHFEETTVHRLLIGKTCRVGFSVAFIACIAALAALAWLPAGAVMRTALGGHAEHFVAWLGTTIVMGLTCQGRSRLAQAVLLVVYAAVLEAGQLQASGRHASLHDFAFSAAGVATGVLGLLLMRVRLPAALPFVARRRDGAVRS